MSLFSDQSRVPNLVIFLLAIFPLSFTLSHHSASFHLNPAFEDSLIEEDSSFPSNTVSMCLPNYEISEASIIRTKDSVDLGARFINETDLGVNGKEECLRLCCKTPYCNVAVFQEKSSGSCYMFDCGSQEDFRCKFTNQIQYMSAILRRKEIIQVPSTNRQVHASPNGAPNHQNNQHEAELSQLRSRSDEKDKAKPATGGNEIAVSQRAAANVNGEGTPTSTTLNPFESNSRRCSRWQFECKSSGECIAIYNACDGIPNCEDGSDEAPELHCPASALGYIPASGNHGDSQKSGGQSPPAAQGGKGSGPTGNGKESSNDPVFNHKNGGLMNQNYGNELQQQKHTNNPSQYGKGGYEYGNEQLPNPNAGYAGQGQSLPPNPYYGQDQGNPYQQYNPSGYQPGLAMNIPQFNGQPNGYTNPQFQVPPVLQQPNYYGPKVPQSQGQAPPAFIPVQNPVNKPEGITKPMQPQTLSPLPPTPAAKVEQKSSTVMSEDKVEDAILKSLKNQPYSNSQPESAAVHILDSEELSPHKAGSGAVFLFIVGLGMSIVLAVVVGCRLKRLGAGSRRRRKNRLDPDYLVDGMYL